MRKYSDLFTLISRETNSKIPRAASQMIKTTFNEKHPTATAFVLFKTRSDWTVVPVGPNEAITTTAEADKTRTSHGRAIAYCPREPVPVGRAVNPFAVAE